MNVGAEPFLNTQEFRGGNNESSSGHRTAIWINPAIDAPKDTFKLVSEH